MQSATLKSYPAGSLLRVRDIVGDRKAGVPGLLPIVARTWLKWSAAGRVPPGIKLGPRTRAWRIEDVLAVAEHGVGEPKSPATAAEANGEST